jgi:subtilisin family serine protease
MTKITCRNVWLALLLPVICMLAGCGGSPSGVQPSALNDSAAAVSPQATGDQPVIIGFASPPGKSEQDLVTGLGGKIRHSYHLISAIAATFPGQSIARLKSDARVKTVEVDAVAQACSETVPWGVSRVQAPSVQAGGNSGVGVKVAVIDTGIEYTHPDLSANYKGGYDYVNADSDPMDDHGHGTHCAGIIAAAAGNGLGVVGVAPGASLHAVKVLDAAGSGSYSSIIAGLQWCVDNHMQVASMSLGGTVDSLSLHNACDAAVAAGVTVVAAAGNAGPGADTVGYPAKYSSVIAVSATDQSNAIASFSSTGPSVAVAAPGVSIYSTYRGGGYATMSGTSMACPHVAGTAALVIAAGFGTPAAVRSQITGTALDLGATGLDPSYGYGLDQADLAVGGVPSPPPAPPPATVTHDVGVTSVQTAGNLALRSKNAKVTVGVTNLGGVSETTSVTVTDSVPGGTFSPVTITLAAGASTTVSLPWVPTVRGSQTLTAAVRVVAGETATSDNQRAVTVKVK